MTRVFHRAPKVVLPMAVAGDGAYLIDAAGKRYLDASGGAAVSCLGHSDREVIEAIKAQLDRVPFAHTGFFTNAPMEDLAEWLTDTAPPGFSKVYFVSGGSEAVETAVKMARQYFVETHEPQRTRLIARRQSYHGNTLGALAVGGNPGRRQTFEPLLIEVRRIAPCYAYRHQMPGETVQAYALRAADELEEELQHAGPETAIAFFAETVVGATLGAVPPAPGYFRRIREICDQYGLLMILDEVMCGMGRTGTLFACEQEGVSPDLICLAKGLGAGYQPIGAVLVHERIYDAIVSGSGAFSGGHTYMGHPTACAGALAVQRAVRDRNLLARVRELGVLLHTRLSARFADHPHIGDIRGRGLFWGLEMVRDRETKEPFPPELKLHARIKACAMEQGLICYPNGGTADGSRGDHILLGPPFILREEQLDELTDKLDRSIAAALSSLPLDS
ncbi:MAG: aspartate aminotransferase family protein [Hyphomicrobiales bacterium]|nr:aspartate aminotransferase family protein [Hyphomicrobiales bacterium]